MKHEVKVRYPVPAGTLVALFTEEAFHTRKLRALGVQTFKVLDCGGKGREFAIRIELRVPMQVPGMLKKVISPETTALHEERWNRSTRTGSIQVSSAGAPVDMCCATAVADAGQGCVVTYYWEVKARIPLVAGALERFICADIDERARREQAAATALAEPLPPG